MSNGFSKLDTFHTDIEQKLKDAQITKKALFLIPRGHWKSTFITISWVIQKIMENPDVAIFISNAVLTNAAAFLREIKGHFEKNEKLRAIMGDVVSKSKWGELEIIVANRRIERKEPTIRVGSVDHSVVSSHFDIVIGDDLVNRENINTKEQCEKVIQYYRDLLDLGKNGETLFIIIGTVWHYADLYQFLLKENERLNNLLVLKLSCWKDKEKQIPLFYKFTKEYLLQLRAEKGSYEFSKQYENSVIDDSNAVFKLSHLQKTYKAEFLNDKYLQTFITIDAAMSKSLGSDYTGVIVNSVDAARNWYLRLVKRLRINSLELVNLIFDLWTNVEYKRHGLIKIGVEQKAFNDLIRPMLTREAERRSVYPVIEELKDMGIRKQDRISGALQGRFENGKIHFLEDATDDSEWLRDELISFPLAKNDDLGDALAYQEDIVTYPDIGKEVAITENQKLMQLYRRESRNQGRMGVMDML